MGDLFCVLSSARDLPTLPRAPRASREASFPRGPETWRDVLDPGRDPDVTEGLYYTTVVLLSVDSATTEAAVRSRPPSPLADHALGAE